ncbi:MAG: arginase family protein, partial [Candidatus Bathyarchaeia archaeon]
MKTAKKRVIAPSEHFSGFIAEYEKSPYALFGFPFDATSTYRLGSRFGPREIRKASLNIETYSFRTGLYLEDLPICDLGDIRITKSLTDTLGHVSSLASEILRDGKTLAVIGGEHTVTLGILAALPPDVVIVSLD